MDLLEDRKNFLYFIFKDYEDVLIKMEILYENVIFFKNLFLLIVLDIKLRIKGKDELIGESYLIKGRKELYID